MATINELLARAAALRDETALNSISPERAGSIMYDTLITLNELWLQQGSALVISKLYASVAAMQADTSPVSDLTGKPIRPGMIVAIASSDSDNGKVYRFNEPSSWSLVGTIGNITPIDSLDSDSTQDPLAAHQGKVLDGKISQLGQDIDTKLYNKIPFSSESGAIVASTGEVTVIGSRMRTDYIDLGYMKRILYARSHTSATSPTGLGLAFYDASKVFISGSGIAEPYGTAKMGYDLYIAEAPEGAKYVRFTYHADERYGLFFFCDAERDGIGQAYLGLSTMGICKVNVKPGKNLYNKDDIVTGRYINTANNTTASGSNYSISGFVAVNPGDAIHISSKNNGGVSGAGTYMNFYDKYLQFVSAVEMSTSVKDYTIPNDVYFIKFTIANSLNNEIQVEIGAARTSYEEYSPIGGYPIILPADVVRTAQLTQAITELDNKKVDIKPGKNLYNSATNTVGKYFANASGLIGSNSAYSITDYIAVTPGDNIYISPKTPEPVAGNGAYLIFYKSDKTILSGVAMGIYQFTVPANAAFMRFSVANSRTEVQAEIGTSRTTYEAFNPIGGYPIKIPDNSITWNNLSQAVRERIDNNSTIIKFKGFSIDGSLDPGEFAKTLSVFLEKDSLLSCSIKGTVGNILVGVGKIATGYTYFAHWLDIDATNVKLYWYNNSTNVLLGTYPHGMTFTNKTTVVVETKIVQNQKITHLKMFDDAGHLFEQTLPNWGVGAAFITNANTTGAIDYKLQLMPRQTTKKIWLFGDSYISYVANSRWPYYFANLGMLDYFSNNQPGLGPDSAYAALTNMLSLGFTPTFLVWLLGMNGSTSETQSGGQYVINASQKAVIDNVVTLCESYGITPIFGTVPTVPTRQKTGFGNYVRSLGYRVIDMAEAVGADEYGIWHGAPTLAAYTDTGDNTIYVQVYGDGHVLAAGDHTFDVSGNKLANDISSVSGNTIVVNGVTYTRNSAGDVTGLLATDGVHPTVAGAKVLASRVFVDFPELSIIE